MRHTAPLSILVILLTLSACAKAGKEVAEELGIVPTTCGTDGARMEATVGDGSFCADGQIIAVSDGSTAMVTGIGLLGNTLSLQLDTLDPGTYPITEAQNAILFMSLGTPYVTTGDLPGTLAIEAHDPVVRRIKATFNVNLRNEMSGAARPVSGSIDVTYSIEE
jgi:hypothetical protein